MNYWNSRFFYLLFAMTTFTFIACNKDTAVTDVATTEEVEALVTQGLETLQERGGLGARGCYDLVFPVSIVLPDSTTVTVADSDALKAALRTYHNSGNGHGGHGGGHGNGHHGAEINFVYPIELMTEDGNLVTVNSETELNDLREACENAGGPGGMGCNGPIGTACFDLVYPVSLTMPDATVITATDRDDMGTQLRTWYAANPDSSRIRPTFVFPINVVDEDGNQSTVADQAALRTLIATCVDNHHNNGGSGNGNGHHLTSCFTLNFPITLIFPDGTTAVAADEASMKALRRAWQQANPGNHHAHPSIQFPIEVTMEDGTVISVADADALRTLRQGC